MFKEERRKMLKSKRIDDSIKININLQQPPTTTTTTSESSISLFTKDIKKLRKIVNNQNLQIQLLQEKTDSLETKDSEKQAQIQSKNDEIIRLKQTIQSQQENHLFLFNSNAKIWSTLNNLEKRISSNSKDSESNKSEISKEITLLDIKKYLHKNPKEAADVERMARDVKNSLGKKLSDFNESDSESEKDVNLSRKRNHKRQKRMGEKSYKQKNVDDYLKSTTIDEKLEKFGISKTDNICRIRRSLSPKNSLSNIRNSFIEATGMPDQFDDNADWSSCVKNDSEKEKHVSHRHCRLSPTNSIVNVLTTPSSADNGDDSSVESVVSEAPTLDCRRSFTDVTQQLDQFDDISESEDENVLLQRRLRRNHISTILEKPNITSSCSKQYHEKIQNSIIEATAMPDQFDDDFSSSEKNDLENEKHVSHRRSSPPKKSIVLTNSLLADNGDDSSIESVVSVASTFVDCRRSFTDVTQQIDQSDDNSNCDDENVSLQHRRKNRLSTVLEIPNITSSCSKQYREKIQSSIIEVTLMPDQFDDDWSSSEKNDSKNLDQSVNENENDFYMEIPNNFYLWSKNQNKSIKEKESKIAETEMKAFPDKFGHVLNDSDSDVSVMKDQFNYYM